MVLNLEPFDEFETLHYFLKHYYLGLAANGVNFFDFQPEKSVSNCLPHSEEGFLEVTCDQALSHRANFGFCETQSGTYLAGGFGATSADPNHRKLDSIQFVSKNNDVLDLDTKFAKVQNLQTIAFGDYLVIFGGRTSPNKTCTKFYVFKKLPDDSLELLFENENDDLQLYRAAVCKIAENKALAFGGRSVEGKFTNCLKIIDFDLSSEKLISVFDIPNDFPAVASAGLVEISKDRFLIVGGLINDGKISDVTIEFSISEDDKLFDIRTSKIPFGIYDHRKKCKKKLSVILYGYYKCI